MLISRRRPGPDRGQHGARYSDNSTRAARTGERRLPSPPPTRMCMGPVGGPIREGHPPADCPGPGPGRRGNARRFPGAPPPPVRTARTHRPTRAQASPCLCVAHHPAAAAAPLPPAARSPVQLRAGPLCGRMGLVGCERGDGPQAGPLRAAAAGLRLCHRRRRLLPLLLRSSRLRCWHRGTAPPGQHQLRVLRAAA